MRRRTIGEALCVAAVIGLALTAVVQAGPYTGTPNPVSPIPGPDIPTPQQVTGKEYLDSPNKNVTPILDPQQVIAWDGLGGVMDSFDYSGTTSYTNDADALANHGDALFNDVVANNAALLISVTGDSAANSVWSESIFGGTAVWATKAQIDQHGVADLDGLEVWGEDYVDDSDRFSLRNDPAGVSVWAYHAAGSAAFIQRNFIAGAIGLPTQYWSQLDLDALMTLDNGDDYFDANDMALISIRPLGPFDGGEVWVLNGNGSAAFLNHGGHLWNTAFDVKTAFGVNNENIDALEAVAVPEPSTIMLLGVGLFGLLPVIRRKD